MTKILLVEDDKSLREIYGVRLLAEGYDIISAGDGEAALALAIKDRPDLILSDVMMPKISGFDMLDILRSTTETKGIKVIMMTALSSEDQRSRGEQLGADRYLVKSQVGIEDVVRTVHEVLGDAPVSSAQQFTQPSRPSVSVPTSPQSPNPAAAPSPAPTSAQPTPPTTEPIQPATPAPTSAAGPSGAIQPGPGSQPLQPQTPDQLTSQPQAPQSDPIPQAPVAAPAPQPVAPPQPAPTSAQPVDTPQTTPQGYAAAPSAPASPAESTLPQPTAPFSSPRPGSGSPGGNRVIEPIPNEEKTDALGQNFAEQLENELAAELGNQGSSGSQPPQQ